LIDEEILQKARTHFISIVYMRRWNSKYGGVFVEKKKGMISNPYLDNPDITSKEGVVYTKKNPALMTREISKIAKEGNSFQFNMTSLKPLNPNNTATRFEALALSQFEKGLKEYTAKKTFNGKIQFQYMAPLFVEKSCLQCHNKQGYKLGDIRGGISVSFDISDIESRIETEILVIAISGIITVFLLFIIIYHLYIKMDQKMRGVVEELNQTQEKLINISRLAGKSEVAVNAVHSIGNLLTNVFISINGLIQTPNNSILHSLGKANKLLRENIANLADFIITNPKSVKLFQFYLALEDVIENQKSKLSEELNSIKGGLDKINSIVKTQENMIQQEKILLEITPKDFVKDFLSETSIAEDIEISVNYSPTPKVLIENDKLRYILQQLLENAQEALAENEGKKVIWIETGEWEERVIVRISNNGSGISEKNRNKIFNDGYTTKEGKAGTGLHIAANYMKEMNGELSLEELQTEGDPTCFVISLMPI